MRPPSDVPIARYELAQLEARLYNAMRRVITRGWIDLQKKPQVSGKAAKACPPGRLVKPSCTVKALPGIADGRH